ncbi:FMRFamide neuropeptide [Frankliniella fusca]|uniref:FMRFamide neuropeptide n=1 Tax=Frankliniella fusca TaxID=407009 RepID=A0AAE1HIV9_9NEOP|nr:FMRFamide neuropeptide [Frankliniella fusca]
MGPWMTLYIVALAVSCCAAQDDILVDSDPCHHGCDDDALLLLPRRAERSVPVSLIATGMLSRRSALENNFMRFGRSAPAAPSGPAAEAKAVQDDGALRPARADNFMRFGRSGSAASGVERVSRGGDHNSNGFIRFGRSKDNYMRFGRGQDDNFMRFGRPDRQSNFVRFGRDPSNFVRFGRANKDNYMRFGRDPGSNFVRFGRDPSNFVRFGRTAEVEEEVPEDADAEMLRDARAKQEKDNYMRFGRSDASGDERQDKRAKDNYMRFGRGGGGSSASNFVRFGRAFVDEDDSTEGEAAHQEAQDASRTKRPQGM